ncbi:MAG: host-nuclease inhibitor Gam family protein [Nitrospirae bacterium]|nr:host-nuclease inhibitor Gam family protein [Nitrospirota bacterium]
MARLKPKNSITSRAQADAAMSQLNTIDQKLATWDLDEANAIARIREQHQKGQRASGRPGLEAEKALLVKELEAWAEEDMSTWGKRSIETAFGSLGFRVGQPTVTLIKKIAKKWDAALELLTLYHGVYVREIPEIDKAQILADKTAGILDEPRLAESGLAVKQDDEFWIETAASKDLEDAAKKLRAA